MILESHNGAGIPNTSLALGERRGGRLSYLKAFPTRPSSILGHWRTELRCGEQLLRLVPLFVGYKLSTALRCARTGDCRPTALAVPYTAAVCSEWSRRYGGDGNPPAVNVQLDVFELLGSIATIMALGESKVTVKLFRTVCGYQVRLDSRNSSLYIQTRD